MNENERYKIISNDFADLLVEYKRSLDYLEKNPGVSYNFINDKYAVLHIPVSELTEQSMSRFGYVAIPKCYGLMTFFPDDGENAYTVRRLPEDNITGNGVLVGLVDTGIIYTNPIFRYPDNTTKIAAIWDQSIDSDTSYPPNYFYGTEYTREQINEALNSLNPFDVVPSMDTIGEGTAMAGIAAGLYDENSNFAGVAINAELLIVKLKPAKANLMDFFGIPEDAICFQESDIMMGISYLLSKATSLNRPIAICLGIGSSQGSHKGEDIMSNYLLEIGEIPGNAIVLAAGNEGSQRHHYYGEIVPPNYYDMVELNVGERDKNFAMELWGNQPSIVTMDIYGPTGEFVYNVSNNFVGQSNSVVVFGSTTIYIDNFVSEAYSEEQLILFRFKNVLKGKWKFRISGTDDLVNRFNIWLPIRNFISEETYFNYSNPYTTICLPGNGFNTITTTSYNPVDRILDYDASKGFTSINLPKPDVAAPGVNILAPTIDNRFLPFSGTSMASAHGAGVAAGLLEWGIVNGFLPNMSSTIVRYIITSTATRYNNLVYPNPDWGFGLID
ncbi:S8 family peptidase [Anaerocolumna sp. AGMB13025]|uniref:S8 family peptidase n=1 Tax=Anaerocolumna sp. AGMB13025 TaxID=3039116 RepID=UPI00241C7630|nr:S8 family peptidase [Anaerocolumna sp. AGMB13025]WFR55280.1 S8 family peptidase [Anaerocolumna sp. AGMB13025]